MALPAPARSRPTTLNSNVVLANLDGSVTALSIYGHAENDFSHPSLGNDVDNLGGDTGGLASDAGGTDTTLIDFSSHVGSSAVLDVIGATSDPGALSLSATNSFAGYDQVTFKTGGALAGAQAFADIQTFLAVQSPRDFDDPAGYVPSRRRRQGHHRGRRDADQRRPDRSCRRRQCPADHAGQYRYRDGAVTAATANSNIDLRPDNEIVVGTAGSGSKRST